MSPRSLYLHVPFCARRCSYCDFAVQAVRRPPVAAWLAAVEAELAAVAAAEDWSGLLRLETIYVGGGTPSLLGAGAMPALRERLERFVCFGAPGLEWTAEANPESLTDEVARDWADAGVNRVSLGVQTFHEPALRWMGRLHDRDGPARALAAARGAGIGNVSVDLIFGLPARLGRDWTRDLDEALALEPAHISLYGLTAEDGAPLGRWVREGRERLAGEDDYRAEYLTAASRLTAAGFRHYEVSNFARRGRESRHNRVYWSGEPYLGLGPGAHSFLPPRRFWNLRDWDAYRVAVRDGRPAVAGDEIVEGGAARLERVWLALRTADGLPERRWTAAQERLVRRWREAGWAAPAGDAVRLTAEGWLLLDRLAVEFSEAA